MIDLHTPDGVYEEVQSQMDAPAVVHIFVGRQVPRGHILHVEEAAVTNFTTAGDILALGKRDATNLDHWIKQQTGTSLYTCNLNAFPILKENECPIGRVDEPTALDDLYFTVYGWLYKYP